MNNTPNTAADDQIMVTGDSPDRLDVPVWVLACIKLSPPISDSTGKPRSTAGVIDVVLFLLGARFGAGPDDTVRVDRAAIARWVGQRADKITWIFRYLESIGFLTIHRGGRDTVHGGRTPDRFQISLNPPHEYRGARTFVELHLALSHVSPGQDVNPASGGMASNHHPASGGMAHVSPGQDVNPASGGMASNHHPASGGMAHVSPGQDVNPASGGIPRARSESIPSGSPRGEIPKGEKRAIAGADGAPAMPANDEHAAAASQLVDEAPWADPASRLGTDIHVREDELDRLRGAIAEALRTGTVDVDTARDVLSAALAQAGRRPVTYATGAFAPSRLAGWVRSLTTVTLAKAPTPPSSESRQLAAVSCDPPLPACAECGAAEGDPLRGRWVETETGAMKRCACRSSAAAA